VIALAIWQWVAGEDQHMVIGGGDAERLFNAHARVAWLRAER